MALNNSRFSRTISLLILIWIFYGGLSVRSHAKIVYEVIDLGTLGGNRSGADSISDTGQIIGRAENSEGHYRATLFDPTGASNNIDLGTLGGNRSNAFSINVPGDIVGHVYAPPDTGGWWSYSRATLFDPTGSGNNIDLGTLGGDDSWAHSINDAGQIVGGAGNIQDHWHATLFDPTGAGNNIGLGTLGGASSDAYSINDAGQIVGWARTVSGDDHATLFDPTGAGNNIDLGTLGGDHSVTFSINNAGQIVGWARTVSGNYHAILFDPTGAGNNIDLGTLGGSESQATSINDAGQIVGRAYDTQGRWRATLFDPTGAGNNIDFNTRIDHESSWTLGQANDINNKGLIVGSGINPQGEIHAYLLIPKYSGGTGEPNDPYQIATAEDLMLMGDSSEDYDKYFIMTADIDLNPNLPGRKVFDRAVIAPDYNDTEEQFQGTGFTGAFDGNGHTISHLTIEGESHLGLFGQLESEAEVKNLGVVDVNITGFGYYVGGLAGLTWGSITRSYSTGLVSGQRNTGGLVGSNGPYVFLVDFGGDGVISESYSSARTSGDQSVGGLVGSNGGRIIASSSSGEVNGNQGVGGLVGRNGGSRPAEITASESVSTVNGDGVVGGLVGSNAGRIVASCSKGIVTGSYSVGGLAGYNNGSITASQSSSDVKGQVGSQEVGGLVGYNIRTIRSCYSTGEVSGEENVGGLVGRNYWEAKLIVGVPAGYVETSYSTGKVSGTENIGGLIGDDPGSVFSTSFWDVERSGLSTSSGGTGKITAEMQTASTFLEAGWDFVGEIENGTDDVWKIVEGQTYPLLSWQKYGGGTGDPNNPYQIYTAEHLNELGAEPNDYDKHFELMADIDLSGYVYDRAVIAPDMNDSTYSWNTPLFEGTSFTGVFDGKGHVISHMTIEGVSYLGLFGQLDSTAAITNLGLNVVDVNGSRDYIGGLSGRNMGSITGSYSNGTVSGENIVGGLVGNNWGRRGNSRGIITHCYSKGSVDGVSVVGGLVGTNEGEVAECHSNVNVRITPIYAGGLVGLNRGTIHNSYSTGTVTGNESIGGLVGNNFGKLTVLEDFGEIIRCYSTGLVTGTSDVGGLVGYNGEFADIIESFWGLEASGQVESAGGIGLTTSEMQTATTYLNASWDFINETVNGTEDIWWIDEGNDYPRLWWELIPEN